MELIQQIITNVAGQYGISMMMVGAGAILLLTFGAFKLIRLAVIAGLVLLVGLVIVGLKITGVI